MDVEPLAIEIELHEHERVVLDRDLGVSRSIAAVGLHERSPVHGGRRLGHPDVDGSHDRADVDVHPDEVFGDVDLDVAGVNRNRQDGVVEKLQHNSTSFPCA